MMERSAFNLARIVRSGGFLVVLLLMSSPVSAQITFPGASPVSAGNLIMLLKPETLDYTRAASNTVDKNVLIYGASPNLAIILQGNTFVSNSATITEGGRSRSVIANGFGDTLVQARYTIFQQDGPGSTFRIAPYAGVILPTGMDSANNLMPRGGQPGTGAFATRDAVTMSYQTLDWNAAAEAGYQANSAAADYQFGNTIYADVAFHYRLWPVELGEDVAGELYASIESNYTSTLANRGGGQSIPGTGGQMLLVDPGIIYTTRTYSLTLTGLLPAYQHIRDNGNRLNYGLLGAFRYSFFTSNHW